VVVVRTDSNFIAGKSILQEPEAGIKSFVLFFAKIVKVMSSKMQ